MPIPRSIAIAFGAATLVAGSALAQTAPAAAPSPAPAAAPAPAPAPAPAFAPLPTNQVHLARNLAATCANCHGTNGNARGDMKPLAGVSADKIISAMADFKSGAMPATIMHQISKGYTDAQIRLIAEYLAAQKPAAAK